MIASGKRPDFLLLSLSFEAVAPTLSSNPFYHPTRYIVGITGHLDLNSAPPSRNLLK